MNKRRLITALIIIVLIILLGYLYTVYKAQKDEAYKMNMAFVPQQIEDKIMAPDFTLTNMEGNKVSLSDYRGKIVFLNFWATWCRYCKLEMPDFEEVHNVLLNNDKAVILTVNVQEKKSTVENFIEEYRLTLPVLLDTSGEVSAGLYGVQSLPMTFIINPDGTVYNLLRGMTDKETLEMVIEKMSK